MILIRSSDRILAGNRPTTSPDTIVVRPCLLLSDGRRFMASPRLRVKQTLPFCSSGFAWVSPSFRTSERNECYVFRSNRLGSVVALVFVYSYCSYVVAPLSCFFFHFKFFFFFFCELLYLNFDL